GSARGDAGAGLAGTPWFDAVPALQAAAVTPSHRHAGHAGVEDARRSLRLDEAAWAGHRITVAPGLGFKSGLQIRASNQARPQRRLSSSGEDDSRPLASSSSTSTACGTPACAPIRVHARDAAAEARRNATAKPCPRASAATSAPQNVSPAPVVSTASTANADCTSHSPSMYAQLPCAPSVTTTFALPSFS